MKSMSDDTPTFCVAEAQSRGKSFRSRMPRRKPCRRWLVRSDPDRRGRAPAGADPRRESKLFKPDDADYLLSFLPAGSPHVVIPEAEHHVMIDQPLAFVAALRALLEAWPRTSLAEGKGQG